MFVLESLIKSSSFYPNISVSDQEISLALDAIVSHTDKNVKAGTPIVGFWNQVSVFGDDNKTHYAQSPPNIDIPLGEAEDGISMIRKALDRLGLKKYADALGTVLTIEQAFSTTFQIPSDADDTGCNLALGRTLADHSSKFPSAAEMWRKSYKNIFDAFLLLKKYSYQPFLGNYPQNLIDPRTYLWIRGFLKEQRMRGNRDLSLITTWLQTTDEIPNQRKFKHMPFNVNNVDLSVTANSLFGITEQLLLNQIQDDPNHGSLKLVEGYLDNIALLTWALREQIVEKFPTHSLLYYPPKFAFYWFVSRLFHTVKSSEIPFRYSFLKIAEKQLSSALKTHSSQTILNTAKCDGNYCFWDDFLGNGDKLKDQITIQFNEDRVFSTSMALNALIDTWTTTFNSDTQSDVRTLKWDKNAAPGVKQVILKAIHWLLLESHKFPKENAFFSGSIKTGDGNPFYFPHNSFRWINGTKAGSCEDFSGVGDIGAENVFKLTIGVEGFMNDDEFNYRVDNQKCFGKSVPKNLFSYGLNCKGCVFPYWSSPALTNAMELLALAKAQALEF